MIIAGQVFPSDTSITKATVGSAVQLSASSVTTKISGAGATHWTDIPEGLEAVGSIVSSTVIVVVSDTLQPLASVIITVNISPSTNPVTVGFWSVVFVITAEPLLLQFQLTAKPPVSSKDILVASQQTGPLLVAIATVPILIVT